MNVYILSPHTKTKRKTWMLSWQLLRHSRLGQLLSRRKRAPSLQKMQGLEELVTRKDYEPMGIDLDLEGTFVSGKELVKPQR